MRLNWYSNSMDSMKDLIGKYSPKEPPEVQAIKAYINNEFSSPSVITVQDTMIIITVKSAALANALRMRTTDLQSICQTDKRLVFRIG